MAASLKGKRMPITTPPYQIPSVDIDIFSLVTTFKYKFSVHLWDLSHIEKGLAIDFCASKLG
jgi:hypothetical protein